MKVQAILDKKGARVETVGPDTGITVVASRMRAMNITSLVVSKNTRTLGIVTERDIARAIPEHGAELLRLRVTDLMTKPVTCGQADDVKHVMQLMTRYRVRHVLVMDGVLLAGLISIGDVVKYRLEELEMETAVLRDVYLAHH